MNSRSRTLKLSPALLGLLFLLGCSTWATIITAAQAIALLGGIVYPSLSAFSTEAVTLLSDAEAAVTTYNKTKAITDLAKAQAAIEAIDTQLPAALATLNVPADVKQRAEAAMNVILDYVDGLAIAQQAVEPAVLAARRVKRNAAPAPPKPLTKGEIEKRWKNEVCAGEARCTKLIRGPGFWKGLGKGLGNAIGEAKWD